MTDDNSANAAAQAPPPQGAGVVVTSGAPVFVDSGSDCFWHIRSVHASVAGGWITSRGYFSCLVFALLYALVFTFAGWLFPQTYQAWLDFCAPLTEYVGGLTPRADRIAGQLVENGYAERAADALHGIAMAKVLLVPVFICLMMAIVFVVMASKPVVFSCARRTQASAWFIVFILALFIVALIVYTIDGWEFNAGENFVPVNPLQQFSGYHRGNFAMFGEIAMGMISLGFFAGLASLFLTMMLVVRFNTNDSIDEDKS